MGFLQWKFCAPSRSGLLTTTKPQCMGSEVWAENGREMVADLYFGLLVSIQAKSNPHAG